MTFNIHQPVFGKESGEYLEKAALRYREELEALFEASVEGKTLADEGIQPGCSDTMMDLGINYLRDDGHATRLRYGFSRGNRRMDGNVQR
ncbi:hypothetical protein ccbrp13_35220 [Ktedonobacteria bacterium brp13]|nr:hypothetical protein ccbrp13_35220 [Ktedonobacteria bacterium brp13]